MSNNAFKLPAFAKINLTLRVLGRRADGYHELHTIFQTISLSDHLTFSPLPDERFVLTWSAQNIPADESNLVHRAALALREHFGVRHGARVELEKRIPAGGGLGGGSSDAAIALLGLARLWKIKTDESQLAEIGARLGADVPFFFTGGTALGTGTGTTLKPLEDVSHRHLLIVAPGVKVSTADAYKALNAPALTKVEPAVMLPISRIERQFTDSLPDAMHNDFESVIFRLYPEIERARNALVECGARRALLSGSGSSVFGIFDSEETAGCARVSLPVDTDWNVFACTTLARADYLKALGR
ncbi:MAG: 4-(cytidine 5'-diphospho)-2-C-methyl-D-erythritol kinase [Pyrinomonadaceae bacterium]